MQGIGRGRVQSGNGVFLIGSSLDLDGAPEEEGFDRTLEGRDG